MSTYDLNARLKQRAATTRKQSDNAEMALDDVARVKVLSPGRKVFKRFIRNRLAVFGSVTLIILFAFSFLGPFLYPYGQKDIFYTFETQNVVYAQAKHVSDYGKGDVVDASVSLESSIEHAMNSNIAKLLESGQDSLVVMGTSGGYLIEKVSDDVFTLGKLDLTEVATVGEAKVEVGIYSFAGKKLEFTGDEIAGLNDAAAENIQVKDKEGTFTLDGVEYSYVSLGKKQFSIVADMDGVNVSDKSLGAGFSEEAQKAAESGENFEFGGKNYALIGENGSYTVYEMGDPVIAKIYTDYTLNTYETGAKLPKDFRANALMALRSGSSTFMAGEKTFSLSVENGIPVVYDEEGNEFAEFSTFRVVRADGQDSLDFDLKEAIAATVAQMAEGETKTATLIHDIPMQDENGAYAYDDDGNLLYSEGELVIMQSGTGEYTIRCDQVKYIIDRYAPPSFTHPLGTDGDGFDVMARIMYGGRISLMVGFVVIIIEVILGIILGGIAGYYGGWVDNLIMRLVDIFYCLPMLPIMIIIGAMMDAQRMDTYLRLMVMMAALGIMGWASVARLVRGQILALREQEFMVATEATGIRVKDRIFRHLVPNVMPQLIVIATMGIGGVILTESTLSFLGLGVKHPLATWGTIINSVSSASAMAHYAFIWIPVGLLISLTVVAFNFVGDGLRDAYDPKSKK